jgi:transglutaminase-like putative cysteine protease
VIYALRHKTAYSYEAPVGFARCVLRLTPQSSFSQTVLQSQITVTPKPLRTQEGIGAFGEQTRTVLIDQPHRTLVIEARSMVDVHAPTVDASSPGPPWEAARDAGFAANELGSNGPSAYLYPTARTPILPEVTDYARASFTPGRPILEAGGEMMKRMHADFAYDLKATDAYTPAAKAFAARRGVCQDFAHIMLCGLRGLGLPAAYVSGYLRTIPPPGQPRLEGADATHAWVRLWCGPERGWIGLDPTNGIYVENDHIVLASGRDYSDVAPIDGVILGPGAQTLKVEVDVIPIEESQPAA